MDNKAADKIRPFLKAMETSIDSAREQRLKKNGGPVEHQQPAAAPETNAAHGSMATTDPPRLKARPKRSVAPLSDPNHRRAV